MLKEEPYSQKEAEAAVGITVDNGKREKVELEQAMAVDEESLIETT